MPAKGPTFFESLKQSKAYFFSILLTGLIPVISGSYIIYLFQTYSDWLLNLNSAQVFLIYACFALTMALALTPSTFVAIISGYYFSWLGLLGIVLAYPLAAVLGISIGKLITARFKDNGIFKHEKYQSFIGQLEKDQLTMFIFIRLSPILPFAVMNLVLAQVKIHWGRYVLGTIVGMFPRTFIFFMAGKNAKEIWAFVENPSIEGLGNLLPVFLIIISSIGLYFIFKRAMNRISSKESTDTNSKSD